MPAPDPELEERTVTLYVSKDTAALWDRMRATVGLDSFDELVQVLTMYGAFLLASADLGLMGDLRPRDLTPEAMRAVFVPWLATASPAFDREGERGED